MQRLLVILLAAFDAVIAVAVGVAVALAPLTLLWVFGVGDPQWAALWPAAGTVWQLGHLVPLSITLPGEYLAATGIPADAASFTLSLAPLAFAGFTAIFAARSGARAAQAGAWITGVITGSLGAAVLSAAIAVTCRNPVATAELWQAVLFPTLVYAVAALAGAIVTAWRDGGGSIDRARARLETLPGEWDAAPGLIARGSAIALTGLIGVAALGVVVALALRGGDVIALFETSQVDALGATVITLGQLAYLPTFVVWALAFIAGPGFAIGVGTAVTPAGTQLGVVPAIPLLGAVPESTSPWVLTVVMLPVIVGAMAGWAVRARIPAPDEGGDAAAAVPVHPALAGLIPERADVPDRPLPARPTRPVALLATVAVGIALVAAAGAGLLAFVAAGSLGPGRLVETGPSAAPVALAVGLETLVGAAIVLLTTRYLPGRTTRTPRRTDERSIPDGRDADATAQQSGAELVAAGVVADERPRAEASGSLLDDLRARVADVPREGSTPGTDNGHGRSSVEDPSDDPDTTDTAPIDLPDPSASGPRRPAPLPPID